MTQDDLPLQDPELDGLHESDNVSEFKRLAEPFKAEPGVAAYQTQDSEVLQLGLGNDATGRRGHWMQGSNVAGDIPHQGVAQALQRGLHDDALFSIGHGSRDR